MTDTQNNAPDLAIIWEATGEPDVAHWKATVSIRGEPIEDIASEIMMVAPAVFRLDLSWISADTLESSFWLVGGDIAVLVQTAAQWVIYIISAPIALVDNTNLETEDTQALIQAVEDHLAEQQRGETNG